MGGGGEILMVVKHGKGTLKKGEVSGQRGRSEPRPKERDAGPMEGRRAGERLRNKYRESEVEET